MLSEDVVAWTDGGGRTRAALRPVTGRAGVLAFVTGLLARYRAEQEPRLVEANGRPALWLTLGGQRQLVALDVRADGRVHAVFTMLNPDKLVRIRETLTGEPEEDQRCIT